VFLCACQLSKEKKVERRKRKKIQVHIKRDHNERKLLIYAMKKRKNVRRKKAHIWTMLISQEVTKSLKSCSSIVRKEIENLVYINMEKLSH
jgi:hypothetical protein